MAETILIVDDQASNARLLKDILEREGYLIYLARDGQEGLEAARRMLPDLILLDILMPIKDGFQVCTELREDPDIDPVPIIFLSGKTDPAMIVKGLDAGGNDYIAKPFNKSEVLARIRTQLKTYQLRQRLNAANADLKQKQSRIEEDLQAAAVIQRSLLPLQHPDIDFGILSWSFAPCEKVGGDIFNFFQLDEEHWALYMLDVSGHGVPSSMISVSVSQLLHPQTGLLIKKSTAKPPFYQLVSPSELLSELDRLYPFERFGKFFTMSYVICNCRTGELCYSSAGHPPPVILRQGGKREILDRGGPIIGLGGVLPYDEGRSRLDPGDRLYLYTDGIFEKRYQKDGITEIDGLYALLAYMNEAALSETVEAVFRAALENGDADHPHDDVSILGFEFSGIGPQASGIELKIED